MFALTATEVIGESNVSWWDIALAALVVILAIIAARVAGRATARMVGRLEGIPPNTGRTIARTAAYTVLLLGFGVALSALGADIQPLQTAAIVAAVLAFLLLRGIAGQFMAGLVVRTTHPLRVGDHVESGEHVGVVKQITSVATTIETYDGRQAHVPNLELVSKPIVNRTAAGALRVDVEVRATWTGPVEDLLEVIRAAAVDSPDVLPSPETLVGVRLIDADRITAVVRPWHDPELDSDIVAGGVATEVNRKLAELGIPNTTVYPPPLPPFTMMSDG